MVPLKRCKLPESKKLDRGVNIRLADGSLSDQVCTAVQINVSTDLYHVTNNPFDLTFLVVDGPNNLIGRHAPASMWPVEFQAFKEATTANFVEKFPYEEYAVNFITKNRVGRGNFDRGAILSKRGKYKLSLNDPIVYESL